MLYLVLTVGSLLHVAITWIGTMMIILRKRTFFARYEKVNGLVSDVYAAAKKADRPLVFFEHFSNSAITDECEGTNVEGNITNNFNNGAWNRILCPVV